MSNRIPLNDAKLQTLLQASSTDETVSDVENRIGDVFESGPSNSEQDE